MMDTTTHGELGDNELECRVCRLGGESDHPLYTPCLCSGSIGLVHQDCLEAWLAHSKKDKCELCLTKYQFEPQYRPDTPSILPIGIVLKSLFSLFVFKFIPIAFRVVLAIVIWLVMVPIGTTVAYCTCLRRNIPFVRNVSLQSFGSVICYGLVIDGIMALSLLILMSFADFLRFHWQPAAVAGQPNPQQNAMVNAVVPVDDNAPGGAQEPINVRRPGIAARRERMLGRGNAAVPGALPPRPRPHHDHLGPRPVREEANGPEHVPQFPPIHPHDENDFNLPLFEEDPAALLPPSLNPPPTMEDDGRSSGSEAGSDDDDDDDNYEDIGTEDDDPGVLGANDNDLDVDMDHNENDNNNDNNMEANNGADGGPGNDNDRNPNANANNINVNGNANANANNINVNGNGNNINGNNDDNNVQIAIMDILGIEGPIFVIIRNAAWLLAFSSVYLTLLGFFPYVIGSLLFRFVRLKFDTMCPNCLEEFTLKRLWNKVETMSTEMNPPLQCMDFLMIAMGYFTIILVIFGLDVLLSQIRSIRLLDGIHVVADPFRQLTIMVKVGVLLITRIFILPITLGSAIVTLVSYQVLDFTLDTWALFLTQNCVSMYGICWIAGITFMLSMTVSVLQLREVLHPDIFAKLIKPQEAHHDLIASLIQESGIVHAKRMVVSLLVYALLLQMIIGTPLQLFNVFRHSYAHWITATTPAWQAWLWSSLHVFPTDFFQLKVWYWLPELQIPFELILGHITFLTVLDQKKDLVGRMQHRWMVWLSGKLGMTRFIIPVPMLKRRRRSPTSSQHRGVAGGEHGRRSHRSGTGGGTTAILRRARRLQRQQQQQQHQQQQQQHQEQQPTAVAPLPSEDIHHHPTGGSNSSSRAAAPAATPAAAAAAADAMAVEEVIEVGPPLVRPPPGWDVRGHGARWAWINETPSAIERNVAPRVIPSHWLWRTCLLIGISWCLSIVVALFLMVVPLYVGRSVSQLLCVPLAWQHDPLHFIMGLYVVKYALDTMEQTSTLVTVWEKLPTLWQQVPVRLWRRMSWIGSKRMVSYWLVGVGLYLLAHPASSLALLMETWATVMTSATAAAAATTNPLGRDDDFFTSEALWFFTRQSLRWMVAGWIVLDVGLLIILRTSLVRHIGRYFGGTALAAWLLHCQVALERVTQDVSPLWERNAFPSWTAIDDVLTLLDATIVSATLIHVSVDAALLVSVFVVAGAMAPEMKASSTTGVGGVGGGMFFLSSVPSMLASDPTWISWLWFGLWLSSLVVRWCSSLLREACVHMYSTLRDQHYLIGRQLKNAVREVRTR